VTGYEYDRYDLTPPNASWNFIAVLKIVMSWTIIDLAFAALSAVALRLEGNSRFCETAGVLDR